MAASKKKPVSKDDLRRLMKETKTNVNNKDKKVDHPHAKYNCLGQLVCSICNTALKSSLLWNAHIQGRQHKENLVSQNTSQQDLQQVNLLKRKLAEKTAEHDNKKKPKVLTSILKNGSKTNLSNKTSFPEYDDSSDESMSDSDSAEKPSETNNVPVPSVKPSASSSAAASSLPKDFFDSTSTPAENKDEAATNSEVKMSSVLPEGFFDDPVIDAKVRKVEYKDKMEEEWELFQKQMKEETHVSEAIMEDEDEQANVDRNIDEIDEQMHRWSQINDLQDQKEKILQVKSQTNQNEGDDDDDDDSLSAEDFKDFLDWRSKKPWT
ncbi:zinc finger protein 830-like [Argonauta hians]